MFTPYHRRWTAEARRSEAATPDRLEPVSIESEPLPEIPDGGSDGRLEGGSSAGRDRLDAWLPRAADYDETRNALAIDGTSHLSADLHFGTLSPLEVEREAADVGADDFIRQLAWRDFNAQVLYHRPEASWSDYRDGDPAWNEGRGRRRVCT